MRGIGLALVLLVTSLIPAVAQQASPAGKAPAVWILPGQTFLSPSGGIDHPSRGMDFAFLKELHEAGFNVDAGYSDRYPINWENLKRYNVLVLNFLPLPKGAPIASTGWNGPPYSEDFLPLVERFLAEGGGVLLLLDTADGNRSPVYENNGAVLARWGAKLPLEKLIDPGTETRHPRSVTTFIYTTEVSASPVSAGVRGVWYPNHAGGGGNANFDDYGQPLDFSPDWTVVLRGSPTCYSEEIKPAQPLKMFEHFTPYVRPGRTPQPALYGIREVGGARMALSASNSIFHLSSGTSWVHDRVMLGKGLRDRPSDFDVLLKNTLTWLAQPSLDKGTLGGYQQDPQVLLHPHFRRAPSEFFGEFDSYQNQTAPGKVYRGLVGARTANSCGQGTVADYAAAARRVGLDFVVFLEDFSTFSEAKLRQLEADCKRLSDDRVVLIPGWTMLTNVGNHVFFTGYDHRWPTGTQLDGPRRDRLRLQCHTLEGKLAASDDDAKQILLHCLDPFENKSRNVGYFDFAGSEPGSVPVRNLRLYGLLAVMTYRDGKQVEDMTPEYLQITPQGNPPRLCAVDIVDSPQALADAVGAGHYLTHVSANGLGEIPQRMAYGHQYGRDNVNPSNGPQIHAWAQTDRMMTYAGEPWVTARRRLRPEAWVTSEVGLKEVKLYSDGRLYRRFLLNGAKEFRQVFEWSYDQQRVLVAEATDVKGGRAISAGRELWSDANINHWCGDRQNGELWHGPFMVLGPWGSGVVAWMSIGKTWDGGGALTPFAGINVQYTHPGLREKDGTQETGLVSPRMMEGYTYFSNMDESCRNMAGEAWNVYSVPGLVANGYNTLGPISPAQQMSFTLRRTQYVPRISGPCLDIHAMWPERTGGGLAMYEGEITLKKDMEFGEIQVAGLTLVNFPEGWGNVPTWIVGKDPAAAPYTFTGLKAPDQRLPLAPGGYVGMVGSLRGTPSAVFNVGDTPIEFNTSWQALMLTPDRNRRYKAGDKLNYRYLYLFDQIDQPDRTVQRLDKLRAYFGLSGQPTSGLQVKQGKVISDFGLVDLAPEKGVVEFELPAPDFNLDVPLGMRFMDFNRNWTVGQYQIKGYSPGYYSKGDNVYRNLAPDDKDIVHLAVYTTGVPLTHCLVGHPVQCSNSDLIIEVTKLSDKPEQWHVAVNNPTDAEIKTVLRKGMAIPGLDFPDTPVTVPAGGYVVVKEK